jgi:GT2 family glycosyltransferase/glycosyltransferase involved in cell wall biosynthesis
MEVSNKRKIRAVTDLRPPSGENSRSLAPSYDAFYYAHNCGRPYERDDEWLGFFGSIAERIVRDIGPGTVLDAGCAMGFLVEGLRNRGVTATGIDISEYAIQKVHADVRPYCWLGSVTDELPQRYDLIVCIEVLEHLPAVEANQAIENFCKHTDDILFSSTPFDYKEATHFNVRPPDYWGQRFAQHGFIRDLDFDGSFITPWTMRFKKTNEPAWRIVQAYERHLWQLEKEIQARRLLTVEQQTQLAASERTIHTALAEKAAEKEQALQTSAAELVKNQEIIESLTTALSQEQDRTQQLIAQEAERAEVAGQVSAQLAEHYQRIDSLIAPVVVGQSSLDLALTHLLETQNTIDELVRQLGTKEEIVSALRSEIALQAQTLERLRGNLVDKDANEQKLEAQIAEGNRAIEVLLAAQQESERAIQAVSASLVEREHSIRALASQQKAAELTINALSQRQAQSQQIAERLYAALADKDALLANRDARLLDIDSSMAWYLYNRVKYPYLIAFYRLYERIKYPYLLSLYRRLGLARQSEKQQAEICQIEDYTALPPHGTFLVLGLAASPEVSPHTPGVDVIICIHDALEDVKRCLESVVYHTRMPYLLILVDDGSAEETRSYVASFAESQGAVLIRNEQAKGYTLAANQGLRRSQAQYALLLNSDTVVTALWLDRMVACGESEPHIGLVGPLSNVASWQSIPEILRNGDWAENRLPEDVSVADMGKLLGQQSARLYPRIPFLNGFCLLIKRSVIEEIGYFDEAIFGKGYGEENDYCLRALKAGWQLSVADDAYVYHAHSRSYSHTRRKELSRLADIALQKKHEPQMIFAGVAQCRLDRILQGIRARSRVMFERAELIEEGMRSCEGKRVAFILPIASACGGGNVVLDEAEAIRKMGVDARVINLRHHQAEFERSYPDNKIPVLYAESEAGVRDLISDYDAVVATYCKSVYWLTTVAQDARERVRAYYVQDFEPHFFTPEMSDFRMAWNSYTEHPDLVRFTKTEWNREMVKQNTGVDCLVVGPSVNIDLYRPRKRLEADWPMRPLRVAAMVRPSTPRRNASLTMEVLREYYRRHGETVEIILFGCESSDPEFLKLPRDFVWHNAGMLTRPQLASLLNEIDIFGDFSEYQAMGLTAMEAMACGAAVIVPQKGGAYSFATHEKNALIIDTSFLGGCLDSLERITVDEKLRFRLQQQALIDACDYYPEKAARNILKALFPSTQK